MHIQLNIKLIMAIEKPNKKKPGFSFDEMDNFQIEQSKNESSAPISSEPPTTNISVSSSDQPKKRGRRPGTKLAKSYKFQLVPGAVETQLLITIPVELHESIKEKSQLIGQTVKEYVSKGLAHLVDFKYEKNMIVATESAAVASVAEYPWTWNNLQEEYRTPLVFQTLINTNPGWFKCLNNVTDDLKATITQEQWIKIVTADYNAIKQVPQEYLNFVLKSIKELLNE